MLKRTQDRVEAALPDLGDVQVGQCHRSRLKPWGGFFLPFGGKAQYQHGHLSSKTTDSQSELPHTQTTVVTRETPELTQKI